MVACAVNLQLQIIALERDERNRAEFRRFTSQFQPGKFLFVDESSKDERILLRCAANIARHQNSAVFRNIRLFVLSSWGTGGVRGGYSLAVSNDYCKVILCC